MEVAKLTFSRTGFFKLRSAEGVVADLERRANKVARAARAEERGNYVIYSQQGKKDPQGRWRVSITTGDYKTIRSNAKNHTLLRAIDAARE